MRYYIHKGILYRALASRVSEQQLNTSTLGIHMVEHPNTIQEFRKISNQTNKSFKIYLKHTSCNFLYDTI